MKHIFTIFLLACYAIIVQAQSQNAFIDETGSCSVVKTNNIKTTATKSNFTQMAGWPKNFSKDKYYMSVRGVCLQDLNNDGKQEVIFGSDNFIYAYEANGNLLWQNELQGTAYYPPSCCDIDNDGHHEVLFYTRATAGTSTSYFYIFDHSGNVKNGFPKLYNATQMLMGSPVIADFDGDLQMEIIVAKFGTTTSQLYVYQPDGTIRDGFPVSITGRFAVTPSVGYDHATKTMYDSVILINTTKAIYALDLAGNVKPGFPVEDANVSFSYQSPLICHSSNATNYVGASHGDTPIYYSLNQDGTFASGWPISTYQNAPTYTAPAAAGLGVDFDFYFFTQRETDATLHAFTPEGTYLADFPQPRANAEEGGSEGVTTLMYSTDLSKIYIFGTSISANADGKGYVHIYEANANMTNFHEIEQSPLLVQGMTFMSAVNLGDIDANGKLDLVVLSYDNNMTETDSTYINIFETDIEFNANYTFPTYKGNNQRTGFITPFGLNLNVQNPINEQVTVYPNPVSTNIEITKTGNFAVEIYDLSGRMLLSKGSCLEKISLNVENLNSGVYFAKIFNETETHTQKFIKL